MVIFGGALLVFIADLWTKQLIVKWLPLYASKPIWGSLMSFTHVHNTGAAFSILRGQRWLFVVLAVVALVVISIFVIKIKKKPWFLYVGLPLFLGGISGNLVDRIRYGYVIDFIDFHFFPIFNVADMAIVVGEVLIVVYLLFYYDKEAKCD